jgi:hypothetical protein
MPINLVYALAVSKNMRLSFKFNDQKLDNGSIHLGMNYSMLNETKQNE